MLYRKLIIQNESSFNWSGARLFDMKFTPGGHAEVPNFNIIAQNSIVVNETKFCFRL